MPKVLGAMPRPRRPGQHGDWPIHIASDGYGMIGSPDNAYCREPFPSFQ